MTLTSTHEVGDADGNHVYRRITLRLIPFIFICYLFNYLDRVNVGFAKLQMLDALSFSETVYGLGAGIFFVGYVLCGLPSNLALNRFGPRRWIGLMMITWGIFSTCLLFVTTPVEFYVLRFLTGMAEAGFFPVSCCTSRAGTRTSVAAGSWHCSCRPFRFPGCSAGRFPAGSSTTLPPVRAAWRAGNGCF